MFKKDTVISPAVDVAAMIEAYELSRCEGCTPPAIHMGEGKAEIVRQLAAEQGWPIVELDWGNPHNPSCDMSPLHAAAWNQQEDERLNKLLGDMPVLMPDGNVYTMRQISVLRNGRAE